MKTALIIGGSGFVGHHLAHYLHNRLGWGVLVTKLPTESLNLPFAGVHDLDILEPESVNTLLEVFKPDFIFHLAAQSSAALSWVKPQLTVDINIKGTINVLESIRGSAKKPRVLLIGSSEEYGKVLADECPISERQEPRPGNIYAVTKVCQEMIGKLYTDAYGMDIALTRSFNHIGPGQSPVFVVSDFCKQVAEIEAGKREPVIKVGNLEAKRDFTDVRDVVRAYALLIEKGAPGDIYNVGSGRAIAIQELLDEILRLSTAVISVVRDKAKYRPLDARINVADITKLREVTGWNPEFSLSDTLAETLNYWRKAENHQI